MTSVDEIRPSARPLRLSVSVSEDEPVVFGTNSLQRRKKGLGLTGLRPISSGSTHSKNKQGLLIGLPQNFRQISSIIDVDILPETHRRVRLHKHGTHKPLGFYIRDGVSVRVAAQGMEKVRAVVASGPPSDSCSSLFPSHWVQEQDL